MIAPGGIAAAIWLLASHEAWESVIFGGMIPILGALAVVWLLWWAIKDNPSDDAAPAGEADDQPHDPRAT